MSQSMSQEPITAPLPTDTPRARDLIQSISADFYNVSDSDGKPTASLVVLVNSNRKPVRAELHLSGTATDEGGRQAIRQAQHIIEERYRGPEALPMQVWQSFLRSDPLQVPLPPEQVRTRTAILGALPAVIRSRWMAVAIGAATLVVIALIWGLIAWARTPGEAATAVSAPTSGGIEAPAGDAAVTGELPEGDLAPVEAAVEPAQPEALPTSKTADSRILVGTRVRILEGFKLSLCPNPGPCLGNEVGYMENSAEATVIGGPTQLKGNTDTIVWWEVKLDDTVVGWAAANESNAGKLLEPAD